MDDLSGLDWSSTSNPTSRAPSGTGNYYPALRPTPPPQLSGRNTPVSNQASGAPKPFAPPKPSTPDSFSNLVSFGSSKTTTLTLQEQQEKLQAQKRKLEEEKRKQYDAQFGSGQFWDGLGSKSATPPVTSRSNTPASRPLPPSFAKSAETTNGIGANAADDDLFAAFNADTKVDRSSNYPPPSIPSSGTNTPGIGRAWERSGSSMGGVDLGDDDDPFGLVQIKAQSSAPASIPTVDDDDFLGDLGKPVEEVRRKSPAIQDIASESASDSSDDPWDKAVAELVDMGFTAEQSRRALTESGSGLDIQAAVGWILNDAHKQSKSKQQSRDPSRNNGQSNGDRREISRDAARRENNPAWMREESRDHSQPKRDDNRSPASGDGDLSKAAAAVGSNLFKTANSLWKTSQKKVQKAVAEFQQESDPSQPKWMREAAEREQEERRAATEGRECRPKPSVPEVTDEALMLEGGGRPPKKAKAPESRFPPSSNSSRDQSPSMPRPPPERPTPIPRWQQSASSDPKSRISKQAIEEQSAQAYVSPARRKKATPQPQSTPEPDLLLSSSSSQLRQAQSRPTPTQSRSIPRPTPVPNKPSTPIQTRPKAPPRNIPPISNIALQSSNQDRLAGTNHFKRGDYASAHQSYTTSLNVLPEAHPITIILRCNRALTALKTGVPREAVADADTALALIGVSRGDGEVIDLGPGEAGGKKEMKEFWGKALMRKAEALEQMEKWREAGDVWKICVEGGVGNATAIQGRTRCEKALAPKAAPAARPVISRPKPKPRSAISDLGPQAPDSEAVGRLRAANKAAEKADDEKFALTDMVDEKIERWRGGKRDNLRALIGSLDLVMWESSGWKKIGMHELVTNGKVKINYMKAIGKCHPDKVRSISSELPQNATTEIKLIAATVFSTLNESWDKFKEQNGM
ncbi:UBA domain-containing 7 [Hyphodiscus hymeniophilus]|uniref:UBA domain-containing 7 n=1 Tax=Hyphodiscus hymeniophilus TaxID=353542 RepID=A0A9P7AU65_9HELO|nr:UBA domain-containing 7 [Hyphodiscus hymeniophilus]